MPRESYNVRILRAKSLDSLRTGVAAFNTLDDRGRMTTVLLGFQHAFEMLLKAALEAKKVPVFDRRSGKSISLESAIRRCQERDGIKLSDEEAGTVRALDALRDAEQHWHVIVDEGLLYMYVRAGEFGIPIRIEPGGCLQRAFDLDVRVDLAFLDEVHPAEYRVVLQRALAADKDRPGGQELGMAPV